jgi:hypothetical protein
MKCRVAEMLLGAEPTAIFSSSAWNMEMCPPLYADWKIMILLVSWPFDAGERRNDDP